jgi:ankyrin repeat protein
MKMKFYIAIFGILLVCVIYLAFGSIKNATSDDLIAAINNGNVFKVHLILNSGEHDLSSKYGLPVLRAALWSRIPSLMIRYLIWRGAYVDSINQEDGHTALMEAVGLANLDGASYLISCGANVNYSSGSGRTVLMTVGSGLPGNSVRIAALLIDNGADVNARSHDDYTPLKNAQALRDNALIEFLKSKGAIE